MMPNAVHICLHGVLLVLLYVIDVPIVHDMSLGKFGFTRGTVPLEGALGRTRHDRYLRAAKTSPTAFAEHGLDRGPAALELWKDRCGLQRDS